MEKLKSDSHSSCLYKLPEKLKIYDKIYIYGAGNIGKFMLSYLEENGLADKVASFVVTDFNKNINPETLINGKAVHLIDEVKIGDNDIILLATEMYRKEMLDNCVKHKIKNVMEIDCFDLARYETLPESEYPTEIEYWYRMKTGKKLDLRHPRTFNEKVQWLKIYDYSPLKTRLVDKYAVKEWVKETIGEEHVVPLFGVWDKFEDIDFDKLPNKFVLKTNHTSGGDSIVQVQDKSKLNIPEIKAKFDKLMEKRLGIRDFRLQYRGIKPRIIAEKYLENKNGDLWDYKFWCFDGKVKLIQIDRERFAKHAKRFYTRDWKPLEYEMRGHLMDIILDKPQEMDEMIKIAEKLSEGFIHVRVDLYCVDGKIYFGEMTFSHESGLTKWTSESMDEEIGKLIKLPTDN